MSSVALFAPKYPPDVGGAAVYFSQLVRALEDTEYKVVVFTPEHDERREVENEGSAVVYRMFPRLGEWIYAGLWYLPRIHTLLKGLQPDIAHVHPHFPQYRFFRWLLKAHRIPRVYDCRDQTFSRRYVGDGTAYLSATESADEVLESEAGVSPQNIRRAPVIVGQEQPGIVHVGKGDHVAFVGDIAQHKGAHVAAEAVKEIEGATLHLAGDGPLVPTLASESHVKYHGCLSHRQSLGLLREVDVLVLPSESEGKPRVALEAIHLGTPVVGTDTGELASVIGDAGVVVPRTVEDVALGVGTVLSDYTYRKRAEERNVGGSIDTLRENVVATYRDVLDDD